MNVVDGGNTFTMQCFFPILCGSVWTQKNVEVCLCRYRKLYIPPPVTDYKGTHQKDLLDWWSLDNQVDMESGLALLLLYHPYKPQWSLETCNGSVCATKGKCKFTHHHSNPYFWGRAIAHMWGYKYCTSVGNQLHILVWTCTSAGCLLWNYGYWCHGHSCEQSQSENKNIVSTWIGWTPFPYKFC